MILSSTFGASTIPPLPPRSPELPDVDDFVLVVGSALSMVISAQVYDGTTNPQWSLVGPLWLSLTPNALSATLFGTPTEAADDATVTVTVTDDGGRSDTTMFKITAIEEEVGYASVEEVTSIPATLTLTGVTDWIYTGRASKDSIDRKLNGSRIGEFETIGDGAIGFNNTTSITPTVSWEDGDTSLGVGSASGLTSSVIMSAGGVIGRGFRLNINAEQGVRQTLRIYLAGIGRDVGPGKGKLSVWLSENTSDARSISKEFVGTTPSTFVADVSFTAVGSDTTLVVEWVTEVALGGVWFRAAYLGEPSGSGDSGVVITPATLESERYVPVFADVEYVDENTSGISLDVNTIPNNAYFVDHGGAKGSFFCRTESLVSKNPIETITFSAMRDETEVAKTTKELRQSSGSTAPPVIGGMNSWSITQGSSTFTRNLTCTSPLTIVNLPRALMWQPTVTGGTLEWAAPGVNSVGTHTVTVIATDGDGRRTVGILTITVT